MKALSFLQPWAGCVLHLGKSTENRPRVSHHRGPVALHVSKGWDWRGELFIRENWTKIRKDPTHRVDLFLMRCRENRGGFAGVFELKDCRPFDTVIHKKDIWAFGPYCYDIELMYRFSGIIPAKGQLGLWNVLYNAEIKMMKEAGVIN